MDTRSGSWKTSFIATKVVALYVMVHAVILAANQIPILTSGGGSTRWWLLIGIIVVAAVGAELWLAANTIADRIAGELESAEETGEETGEQSATRSPVFGVDAPTVLAIGCILVGIVVIADALPALGLAIGNIVQVSRLQGGPLGPSTAAVYWFLLGVILRLGLGTILIFASREIGARLTHRPEVGAVGSTATGAPESEQ
jgi:hypothetical protein